MAQSGVTFTVYASEIEQTLGSMTSAMLRKDALCEKFRAGGLTFMEVQQAPEADFVTEELETFLQYLALHGIRTVMFHYASYTPDELDRIFRMQEANLNLFHMHDAGRDYYGRPVNPESDYVNYLKYYDFVKQTIDPILPHTLWVYALDQRRVIACRIEDDWIRRSGIPTAQRIMQACADSQRYGHYDDGMVKFTFKFDNVVDSGTCKATTGGDAHVIGNMGDRRPTRPRPLPAGELPEPEMGTYERILQNIERSRPKH